MGWPEFSLLGRPLPDLFVVSVVTLLPDEARRVDPGEWDDALVVVEQGNIEIEVTDGGRHTFERGAVLDLGGMSIIMRNPGAGTAVVAAVRRRHPAGER